MRSLREVTGCLMCVPHSNACKARPTLRKLCDPSLIINVPGVAELVKPKDPSSVLCNLRANFIKNNSIYRMPRKLLMLLALQFRLLRNGKENFCYISVNLDRRLFCPSKRKRNAIESRQKDSLLSRLRPHSGSASESTHRVHCLCFMCVCEYRAQLAWQWQHRCSCNQPYIFLSGFSSFMLFLCIPGNFSCIKG